MIFNEEEALGFALKLAVCIMVTGMLIFEAVPGNQG